MRAIACALLVACGCSFTMAERLPSNHSPERLPRCSHSDTQLIGDVLGVLPFGGYSILYAALIADEQRDTPIAERRGNRINLGIGVAIVGAYAASFFYGRHQKQRCRRARAAHDDWLATQRSR